MLDRESARKALDLALQIASYTQLGPAGADLATSVRSELGAITESWPEAARAGLPAAAAAVERERHALDRARNHFIKDFRQRFGMDARRYATEAKAQLDAGMADFNLRKSRVLDDAAGRFVAEMVADGRPV